MASTNKKQKRLPTYRLPDGSYTTSGNYSVKEWRKFSAKLAALPGVQIYGYDPGVLIFFQGRSIDLPTDFVKLLNENLK